MCLAYTRYLRLARSFSRVCVRTGSRTSIFPLQGLSSLSLAPPVVLFPPRACSFFFVSALLRPEGKSLCGLFHCRREPSAPQLYMLFFSFAFLLAPRLRSLSLSLSFYNAFFLFYLFFCARAHIYSLGRVVFFAGFFSGFV